MRWVASEAAVFDILIRRKEKKKGKKKKVLFGETKVEESFEILLARFFEQADAGPVKVLMG